MSPEEAISPTANRQEHSRRIHHGLASEFVSALPVLAAARVLLVDGFPCLGIAFVSEFRLPVVLLTLPEARREGWRQLDADGFPDSHGKRNNEAREGSDTWGSGNRTPGGMVECNAGDAVRDGGTSCRGGTRFGARTASLSHYHINIGGSHGGHETP